MDDCVPFSSPAYWRYWGKTRPDGEYHLLPLHALDVAAVLAALLPGQSARLGRMAEELGWPESALRDTLVFLTALHDLGKFSRAFQGLVPNLSPDLMPADDRKVYGPRHDTLGYWLWCRALATRCLALPLGAAEPDEVWPPEGATGWFGWLAVVCGHHGQPPQGLAACPSRVDNWFFPEDVEAAAAFTDAAAVVLLPSPPPAVSRLRLEEVIRRHGWYLAGLVVLADWIGSNAEFFPYRRHPPASLDTYWHETAKPQAARALQACGLAPLGCAPYRGLDGLFDYLKPPTPLQQFADTMPLAEGPQLFLLEDVTGAGKTEAALILLSRLMEAGLAEGAYFALPSMATANQMYRRVGSVYRKLFEPGGAPSLVLAHSARQLLDDFTDSVLPQPGRERNYRRDEAAASALCSAWLADSRKKSLLAQVGVGTLDQSLLAVLPVRHQSLRLLGLASKVLIVDEVHAYDPYMHRLLCSLLQAHAAQGGSALLLSATLPAHMRSELCTAFRRGLGLPPQPAEPEMRYPLLTHAHRSIATHPLATRTELRRRVGVRWLHSEEEVVERIVQEALAGRCVCWIRNTVSDALKAYRLLKERVPAEKLTLFHSRFAMCDRLEIENRALDTFGKASEAAQRRGQVLVATQVVEQSLDLDFDMMVSDLAPIDLVIQRAGRLHRHRRDAAGQPLSDGGPDQRGEPLLYLLAPEVSQEPDHHWYARAFPKAQYVYPHHGCLWLGWQALARAGAIVTPGEPDEAGAVRQLVEAVYGAEAVVPEGLQRRENEADGKDGMGRSMAAFNALNLEAGYSRDSHSHWDDEARAATRLADESVDVYLALVGDDGSLRPWAGDVPHAWALSCVRLRAGVLAGLAPDWQQRYAETIQVLRSQQPLLAEPAIILPLVAEGAAGHVRVVDESGREKELRYSCQEGVDVSPLN
ncbi:CRISPR-associated helicase Cas3 [Pseudogulbenkiania sp. NH8B]|uniref:CRISPR-associated helicase/endonuclease Cas3 n=1 Tax=Pseudogulbenkiania sp. (strain NH8B) TaxID=748280 RepID=UPI0002279712|nr:CRISPR-associated helicase/endonuclease Cas3 [Pseudogulbenkiania sp. NH8B]BAK75520.1 CRISPR-associated helicase Cas3 [Pseudogulbenkiania sp. NH8B]